MIARILALALMTAVSAPATLWAAGERGADPLVEEALGEQSFVVGEFVSKSCPACEEMRQVVDTVLARHPAVRHQIHDVDAEVELSKKYGVRCVPVYVVMDPNGRVLFNDVGMFDEQQFEEILHGAGVEPH